VNIVFDRTDDDKVRKNCSCFVSSKNSDLIVVDFTDVRLAPSYNEAPGTQCSSAVISSVPTGSEVITHCDPDVNDQTNFVHGERWETGVSDLVELRLWNLYMTSDKDIPEFIWLRVSGTISFSAERLLAYRLRLILYLSKYCYCISMIF